MIKFILDNANIENVNEIQKFLEDIMDEEYEKNMKIRFCDLIGLEYNLYYSQYSKYIDGLYEKFNILSRKFLPNYYETNVVEDYGDVTYLFDFSRFCQKYLIYKKENKNNIILGMKLLLNDAEYIEYKKVGMIKEKVDKFFEENLVYKDNMDYFINNAIEFVQEYDELFNEISKKMDLFNIKLKQYVINADRDYIYSNKNIYGKISYLYDIKQIDNDTINKIINALIKSNIRNNYNNEKENILGLQLYKDFLSYWVISNKFYYLVIEPFSSLEIEFAKAIINGEEIMLRHSLNKNMVSEKIKFDYLPDILKFDVKIKINGEEYKNKLT